MILLILLLLVILYLLAAYKAFYIHLGRYPLPGRIRRHFTIPGIPDFTPYRDILSEADKRWAEAEKEELALTSYDGLTLRGVFLPAKNARGVVVLADGYHCPRRFSFRGIFSEYLDRGFSVLLYDNRATGKSEGKYITMGVKECRDTTLWVKKAAELCPGLPVLVHGVSMGGATVLMALPELPKEVKALVIDSAYCTPHETVGYVFSAHSRVLIRLLMPGVELFARLLAGFSLYEKDTEEIVKTTSLPILFMHGEPDGLVPTDCTRRNERAYQGPHDFLILPGAGHTACFLHSREKAFAALDAFLGKYFY